MLWIACAAIAASATACVVAGSTTGAWLLHSFDQQVSAVGADLALLGSATASVSSTPMTMCSVATVGHHAANYWQPGGDKQLRGADGDLRLTASATSSHSPQYGSLVVRMALDGQDWTVAQLAAQLGANYRQVPQQGDQDVDALLTSKCGPAASVDNWEDAASKFVTAFPYAAQLVDSDDAVARLFISEVASLLVALESPASPASILVSMGALPQLKATGGVDNRYRAALLVYQDVLARLGRDSSLARPVAIYVTSASANNAVYATSQHLQKRSELPVEVNLVFGVNITVPFCVPDASTCGNLTQSCSGHGSCSLTRGVCWKCSCNTGFTGDSCEFNDYVADFHIVLWTTVVLLTTTVAVVYTMLQMGNAASGDASSSSSSTMK